MWQEDDPIWSTPPVVLNSPQSHMPHTWHEPSAPLPCDACMMTHTHKKLRLDSPVYRHTPASSKATQREVSIFVRIRTHIACVPCAEAGSSFGHHPLSVHRTTCTPVLPFMWDFDSPCSSPQLLSSGAMLGSARHVDSHTSQVVTQWHLAMAPCISAGHSCICAYFTGL